MTMTYRLLNYYKELVDKSIAMTVLESIRVQVGVMWCNDFCDMMMETVTKSKVAFMQAIRTT